MASTPVLALPATVAGPAAAAAAALLLPPPAHLIEGAAGWVEELWCGLLALAGQQLLQLALVIDPCMATTKRGPEFPLTVSKHLCCCCWRV
jgi:hypothetical protein